MIGSLSSSSRSLTTTISLVAVSMIVTLTTLGGEVAAQNFETIATPTAYGNIDMFTTDYQVPTHTDTTIDPPLVAIKFRYGGYIEVPGASTDAESYGAFKGTTGGQLWYMYSKNDANPTTDQYYFKNVDHDCYLQVNADDTGNGYQLACSGTSPRNIVKNKRLFTFAPGAGITIEGGVCPLTANPGTVCTGSIGQNYLKLRNSNIDVCAYHTVDSFSDTSIAADACYGVNVSQPTQLEIIVFGGGTSTTTTTTPTTVVATP